MRKNKPSPLINEKGFTLAEILITVAMIAVLTLAISYMSANAAKFISNVDKSGQIGDAFEEVRMTLMRPRACQLNFGGKPLTLTSPYAATSVSSFNWRADKLTDPILKTGTLTRGVMTESLTIRPVTKLTTSLLVTHLEMVFSKTSNPNDPKVTRKLPLFVKLKNNAIDECWLKQDEPNMEYNQICVAATGGALNFFDPGTQSCTLYNGQWYKGTYMSASCPGGTILPPGVAAENIRDFNCRSQWAPGLTDPVQGQTMTTTDGGTTKVGRSAAFIRYNEATQSCSCDWAVELDQTLVQQSSCEILCFKP